MSVAGPRRSLEAGLRFGAGLLLRLKHLLADGGDHSIARRMAGTAFLIRVAGAGILYVSHILLANWMGGFEFGVYVYVWTWLALVGGLAPLGVAYSAQRFIPEYAAGEEHDRLRGFLLGSRVLSFALGLGAAAIGLLILLGLRNRISDYYELPFLFALACLPLYTLSCAQDGIARSYNWINVAIVPGFIAQPLIVLAIVAVDHWLDLPVTAAVTMAATAAAIGIAVTAQGLALQRGLGAKVETGARQYEVGRWFRTAFPIFMVDGFYYLLTYIDILLLKFFVDPAQIGIYYAATKTLVLISFVYYAVSAAFAHRFSEAHFAGERGRLEFLIREAARWTFWPSLAVALVLLAIGQPVLMLFGEEFTAGYPLLFVLVIGLLARASIGPGERLLIMVGEQRLCAMVYGAAFLTNFALCLLLIPQFGLVGAAMSTATALVIESALLFAMARRRLGLHVFFWARPAHGRGAA